MQKQLAPCLPRFFAPSPGLVLAIMIHAWKLSPGFGLHQSCPKTSLYIPLSMATHNRAEIDCCLTPPTTSTTGAHSGPNFWELISAPTTIAPAELDLIQSSYELPLTLTTPAAIELPASQFTYTGFDCSQESSLLTTIAPIALEPIPSHLSPLFNGSGNGSDISQASVILSFSTPLISDGDNKSTSSDSPQIPRHSPNHIVPRRRRRGRHEGETSQESRTCKHCSVVFNWYSDYKRHVESKHEKTKWKCESCNTTLSRKDALRRHKANFHNT